MHLTRSKLSSKELAPQAGNKLAIALELAVGGSLSLSQRLLTFIEDCSICISNVKYDYNVLQANSSFIN